MTSLIPLIVLLISVTGNISSTLPDETQPSATCNSCCQGQAGLPGVPGSAGIPGSNGLTVTGRDGLRGEIGLKGEVGQPGRVGSDGPPGPSGPVSERGESGDTGLQGLPGKVGPRGLEGRPGVDGSSGLDGERGTVGLKGSKGEPGQTSEVRQSAFSVFKTSSQTGSTEDVLSFQQEETNVGSHFSTSTSKFTCQIAGTYFFISKIFANFDREDPCVDLVLDDRQVARAYIHTGSDIGTYNHHSASNSAILQLSTGNQVWLKFCNSQQVVCGGGRYTSFSGFLLYPE